MEIWSVIIDASKLKYVKFISWDKLLNTSSQIMCQLLLDCQVPVVDSPIYQAFHPNPLQQNKKLVMKVTQVSCK